MVSSARPARPVGRPRIPDERIDQAVREALVLNPSASMRDVAVAAGVGKAALYLRYESRNAMLQRFARQATVDYEAALHTALSTLSGGRKVDDVLLDLSVRVVDSGIHTLLMAISGTFAIDDADRVQSNRLTRLGRQLIDQCHSLRIVRPGLTWFDIVKCFEAISAVSGATPTRTQRLRRRLTEAMVSGLTLPKLEMTGSAPTPRDFGQARRPAGF